MVETAIHNQKLECDCLYYFVCDYKLNGFSNCGCDCLYYFGCDCKIIV